MQIDINHFRETVSFIDHTVVLHRHTLVYRKITVIKKTFVHKYTYVLRFRNSEIGFMGINRERHHCQKHKWKLISHNR